MLNLNSQFQRAYFHNPQSWLYPDARNTSVFFQNLGKAINGEYNAVRKYEKLAQLTPNEDFRQIILNIRNDEVKHFRIFSEIYSQISGGKKPQITESPLPGSFNEGVEESIRDELGDSEFYQVTSTLTNDPVFMRVLLNASHDEQRHSTWFSYIWNKL